MAHTLTHNGRPAVSFSRQRTRAYNPTLADDPLDAARGIIFGVMISVLGFWLPLAIALIR